MRYLERTEEFYEFIKKDTVLVDFYAEWCPPCKMLTKELESIENSLKDLEIVKIDTDKFQDLAIKYQITSIPAIKIFKKGKLISEAVGYMDKNELIELINKDK